MDFQTFLSAARPVPNLSEAVNVPESWDFPAIVFPGGVYCEQDTVTQKRPIYYAEVGSDYFQSESLAKVARFLYDFACDEDLLEGIS